MGTAGTFVFACAYWLAQASAQAPDSRLTAATQAIERAGDRADGRLFYDRGRIHLSAGHNDLALTDFNEAANRQFDHSSLYVARGTVLAELGRHSQAAADFTRAIKLKLDDAEPWWRRGYVHLSNSRGRDAIDDFEQAIRLAPGKMEPVLGRAAARLEIGDFAGAIEDADRVLEVDPKQLNALKTAASAHVRLDQHAKAIQRITQAIELRPDDEDLYRRRAQWNIFLGRDDDAIGDWTRIIGFSPTAANLASRGDIQRTSGHLEEALTDYGRAIELDPKFASGWIGRGKTYLAMEDYSRTVRDLEEALRLQPGDEETRRVFDHARQRLIDQSATTAAAAAPAPTVSAAPASDSPATPKPALPETPPVRPQADPKPAPITIKSTPPRIPVSDPEAIEQQAREHTDKGEYRKAIELYTHLIASGDSGRAVTYNGRGFAFYKLRELNLAVLDFDTAINLNPRYANAYRNRAAVRRSLGDSKGAAADLAKATSIEHPRKRRKR